jgi:DNA-directed RNA polymerase subunit H (RpoH/RPB5)
MSDDEKGALFSKMKVDESHLIEFPLLTRRDPIVLYYDFPVGSLIEIERHCPHIGSTKYYRWIR